MADQSAEKQHQATGRRIEDLRKKGQTLRSRDLTSGLVFMVAVIMLMVISTDLKDTLKDNFIESFGSIGSVLINQDFPADFIERIVLNTLLVMLPLFIMVVLVAFLSPFIFGGWNFTLHSLHFKFETLNPIVNLANLFSKKMVLNVLKSILKVIVIMSVLVMFALNNQSDIMKLTIFPLDVSIVAGYKIGRQFILLVSSSLVLIILYDVVTNFIEYSNRIKMTTQELKDEFKETEGNMDIKRKLKSMQMAMLKQRLTLIVPKATVVITNPTHYALAVRYDENKDKAPKVIAKGKDYIAQQIRQIAVSNGVPIYEAPLLARAIYNTSKLNSEINPGLYMAVAIVLSYVHQLKHYQHGLAQQPQYISDLKIPEQFIYSE
ncbi:Flagellar biosynthetic protein FlhB [Aquicella siphonis]|uniref:Flagellar biosynthetic protein FlhB n=1 Tax=Aquicella siphonis TaxID=254247 RepID=A0A5E4PJH2_9COXI|nr:flagellar type III secretion system protein FlhB [Aquicella siphonis]VVC77114.1 Flagellar biosynthetic protein FlhB [Aquicella siphonis]